MSASYKQPQCSCKKEITGWYFNFDIDNTDLINDDDIGSKLLEELYKIRAISNTTSSIITALTKIEIHPDLRKWFLKEIKKYAHKPCYGWQCRFKIIKPNPFCKLHTRNKLQKKKNI